VTAPTMDEAAKMLADPRAYANEPKLHAALTHLRVHAPVSWVDVPSYRSFWAITKPTLWRSSATTRCSPIRHGRCS
jgi:hypothetical protein